MKKEKMTYAKKIAVLGGGNGGHTMAADLALKGYEVNMCEAPEFKEGFSVTLERQAIELIDAWGKKQTVKLNMVTTNFQEALKGASYIMMVVPAIGTKSFFNSIVPYLEDRQTIIKWSGNFSALLFASMLKEKGIKKHVTLAEVHTLPWVPEALWRINPLHRRECLGTQFTLVYRSLLHAFNSYLICRLLHNN